VDTPASEWLVAEVPALRIVDEPLWQAAHRRLAETRAVYARLTDGRLIGRPEGHVESPYLFTGFLRCATCGGTVHVSKQPFRGTMMMYYRCATQRERGATQCPTGVRARLERLEAAILETITRDVLAEDVLTAVVERTIARHVAAAAQLPGRRAVVAGELAELRVRIGRYVEALGGGVAIEEIRGQLSGCKLREEALLGELAQLSPLIAHALDRAKLRARLEEWQGLLRQSPQIARQLLRKLLPEPIVLEPTPEGVRFRGRAAWGAVLAGVMQGVGLVVPPG
jgi:site-specific DNA recombinase